MKYRLVSLYGNWTKPVHTAHVVHAVHDVRIIVERFCLSKRFPFQPVQMVGIRKREKAASL